MKNITIRERARKEKMIKDRNRKVFYLVIAAFFIGIMLGMSMQQHHYKVYGASQEATREATDTPEATEDTQVGEDATKGVGEEIDPPQAVTVSASVKADPIPHIRAFRNSVAQSNMNDQRLETIYRSCKEDVYSTELVVAIAFAETTLNSAKSGKVSNYWGWFPGGDRSYDPDFEIMAQVICNGIRNNYIGVESNRQLAIVYTGNDRVDTWLYNVNHALSAMRGGK